MGNIAATAYSEIKSAVTAPLTEPMDTLHLFLITGLVIIAALLWFRILSHLSLT